MSSDLPVAPYRQPVAAPYLGRDGIAPEDPPAPDGARRPKNEAEPVTPLVADGPFEAPAVSGRLNLKRWPAEDAGEEGNDRAAGGVRHGHVERQPSSFDARDAHPARSGSVERVEGDLPAPPETAEAPGLAAPEDRAVLNADDLVARHRPPADAQREVEVAQGHPASRGHRPGRSLAVVVGAFALLVPVGVIAVLVGVELGHLDDPRDLVRSEALELLDGERAPAH